MNKKVTKRFPILIIILGVSFCFATLGFAQDQGALKGAFGRNIVSPAEKRAKGEEALSSPCPDLCGVDALLNVDRSELASAGAKAFAVYPYPPLEKSNELPAYAYPELGKMSKFSLGGSQDFTLANTNIANVGAMSSVAWGDYDGDGDLDLLISGADQSKGFALHTKIYRNDPNPLNPRERIFTDIKAALPGLTSSSVAWVDYNGDGYLDIFISGLAGAQAPYDVYVSKLYRNDPHPTILGARHFIEVNANLLPVRDGSVAWGDYNADGYPDVAISGLARITSDGRPVYATKIYRNDPDPANVEERIFTEMNAKVAKVAFGSLAWGDYDNDGDLDLALSGATTNAPYDTVSKIYRNDMDPYDGTKSIFIDIGARLPGLGDSSVAWADYNNDGYLDLLVSGVNVDDNAYTYMSKVYRSDPNPSNPNERIFTDIQAGLLGLSAGSALWGDYNNDGYADILLTGFRPVQGQASSVSKVYRSDPNPSNPNERIFTDIQAELTGVESGSAAWGDYDGDEKIDLILTGIPMGLYEAGATVVKLYHNNVDTITPQEALAGPEAGISEGEDEEYNAEGDEGNTIVDDGDIERDGDQVVGNTISEDGDIDRGGGGDQASGNTISGDGDIERD